MGEAAKQGHFWRPDATKRYQQSRNAETEHNRNVAKLAGIVARNANSSPADIRNARLAAARGFRSEYPRLPGLPQ